MESLGKLLLEFKQASPLKKCQIYGVVAQRVQQICESAAYSQYLKSFLRVWLYHSTADTFCFSVATLLGSALLEREETLKQTLKAMLIDTLQADPQPVHLSESIIQFLLNQGENEFSNTILTQSRKCPAVGLKMLRVVKQHLMKRGCVSPSQLQRIFVYCANIIACHQLIRNEEFINIALECLRVILTYSNDFAPIILSPEIAPFLSSMNVLPPGWFHLVSCLWIIAGSSQMEALVQRGLVYIHEIIKGTLEGENTHLNLFSAIASFISQTQAQLSPELLQICLNLLTVESHQTQAIILPLLKDLSQRNHRLFETIDRPALNNCILSNCIPLTGYEGSKAETSTIFFLRPIFNQAPRVGLPEIVINLVNSRLDELYDYEFSEYSFSTACNLLIYAAREGAINNDTTTLKQEVIQYIKKLLSLNESCSLQSRKIINERIIDLVAVYPSMLVQNGHLQEVFESILIDRYPYTQPHLSSILAYYLKRRNDNSLFQNGNNHLVSGETNHVRRFSQMLQSISEKIITKLVENPLSIHSKIFLWQILLRVVRNESIEKQLLQLCNLRQDLLITKLKAMQKLGIFGRQWEKEIQGVINRRQKMGDEYSRELCFVARSLLQEMQA